MKANTAAASRAQPQSSTPIRGDGHEDAYRQSILIHVGKQNETQIATRIEIAKMRDAAASGVRVCSEEAAGLLSEVVRLASFGVFAPWPASRLLRLRLALWMTMEAARGLERIASDDG